MAHTTITHDPAFTDYHAWNTEDTMESTYRLTCVCGLDVTFATKGARRAALKIHMA